MNYWIWILSVAGILSTGVLWGTDIFFLTIGRSALKRASVSAVTEVMGFLHMFADARMPIWGVLAILSNALLAFFGRDEARWYYLTSLLVLIVFVIAYNVVSKPINRLQTDAARNGRSLDNGRALQDAWDRSLLIRVPLLMVSMLTQCLVLVARV